MTTPWFSNAPASPSETVTPESITDRFVINELWSCVLGSGFEAVSEWITDLDYLCCDWNVVPGFQSCAHNHSGPCCLRVTADTGDGMVTRDVTADVLVTAVQAFIASGRVDACTGLPVAWTPGMLDLDACVGDDIMQLAVLESVTFA